MKNEERKNFILLMIFVMTILFLIVFTSISQNNATRGKKTVIVPEEKLSIPVSAPTLSPSGIKKTFLPTISNQPTNVIGKSGLHIYYVSTSGNDAYPGTQTQPFRTIKGALRVVVAGDLVYVRGGVYSEQVIINQSGTQSAPIMIVAYPGETPVIDGSSLTIGSWGAMLNLAGDWIQVSGLEVRYSKYIGVALSGKHNTVDGERHFDQRGLWYCAEQ
jgi:Protein of unknown function (DUF1565)